jgi:hypothetical protein
MQKTDMYVDSLEPVADALMHKPLNGFAGAMKLSYRIDRRGTLAA